MLKQYFLDRLTHLHSDNFKCYNYDLLPHEFKTNDVIEIECLQHGIFQQKACTHLFGSGCPTCGRLKTEAGRRTTTEKFIDRSINRFGNKFDYSQTKYTGLDVPVMIICPDHGVFLKTPRLFLLTKYGCDKCNEEIPRAISKAKFLEKLVKIHNGKYDYSKVNFINANIPVEIVCPSHGSFWQRFASHAEGDICPKCSIENDRLKPEEFLTRSKQIHNNAYDYGKTIFRTIAEYITVTCPVHGDFTQRAGSHLAGNGCIHCFRERNRSNKDDFVIKARKVHGMQFDYSKVIYKNNKTPVEIVCSKHGIFKIRPDQHLFSRQGCARCNESKGEATIASLLDNLNIPYTREYKLPFHLYRYDFFLNGLNIFIEFNGKQHYTPVELFGGEKTFISQKERDKAKADLVKGYKGHLIILTYLDNTEELVRIKLQSGLKRIYKYWLRIDGEVKAFKGFLDVIKYFNLPMETKLENVLETAKNLGYKFEVLF